MESAYRESGRHCEGESAEVDLQRKRIALTMRLDEQPGETNARRGGGNERRKTTARQPNHAVVKAQPAGNSAMMDALAAAMGKNVKRPDWPLNLRDKAFAASGNERLART